jgi:FtsH-binding integral membrane protein
MALAPSVPVNARTAAEAAASERSAFIRRTYAHLAGAILLFILLEYVLLQMPFTPKLIDTMLGTRFSWLIVLGLFMGVGYVADRWARSATSPGMQYLGLVLYVVAEAIIFLPLLFVAAFYTKDSSVIASAGLLTLTLFAGLTGTVFITRKDFSFMRGVLTVGSFVALGLIVAAVLFGFRLGTLFSGAMVVLAGGYILYYTSNIMRHYRTDQHVAAALALFAAVALMFWYILRLFMGSRD